MRDKVDLKVQVAGPNAQKQIQQINAMVQAGAKAIVVYPISPTALNEAVKAACDKGVVIVAYDGVIDEPCAYNVHVDQYEWGKVTAEWLAKKLNGKGNIVMITGVTGTSVDTLRNKARARGVRQVSRTSRSLPKRTACGARRWRAPNSPRSSPRIRGTRSTDSGCRRAAIPPSPCRASPASQTTSSNPAPARAPMAIESRCCRPRTKTEGANGTYRPMGAPSISASSQVYARARSRFKMAVDKLEGKDVPKLKLLSPGPVTNETVKLCETGSWRRNEGGMQHILPQPIVTNPGWFASIYSPDLPGGRPAGGARRAA